MRRLSTHLAVAILGFLAGGATVNHVWLVSHRLGEQVTLSSYTTEQEYLRDRAFRRGDRVAEFVHGLNVADASAGMGFRWLERTSNQTYSQASLYPWAFFALRSELAQSEPSEKHMRGKRALEALARGRAALALEQLGLDAAASSEWRKGESLASHWAPGKLRELSLSMREQEQNELQSAVARAYLDTQTFEEFFRVLADTRSDLGADSGE